MGNMGNLYQAMDDLPRALISYKSALKIHLDEGDRMGEANNLGSMGIVYGKKATLMMQWRIYGRPLTYTRR